MKTRPNESAFPWITGDWNQYDPELNEGMTKRELFAGLICACACANPEIEASAERIVADSVAVADELINRLNKREDAS